MFLKFDHISKDCSSTSPLIQSILQVCSSVFQRERKIGIGARPRWVTSRSSLRRTFHPSDQFPVRENTSARCSFSFFSYSFKRNVDPAPLPQMHSGPMQADPMYQNVPQSIVNKGRSLFPTACNAYTAEWGVVQFIRSAIVLAPRSKLLQKRSKDPTRALTSFPIMHKSTLLVKPDTRPVD